MDVDGLLPDNPHDQALLARVRPPGYLAPQPLTRYDLVVIGGGAAGLVSAMGAAGLGARVALVERHRLGGDCLNSGCVPSKALLRAAKAAHEARSAARFGVHAEPRVDFPALMNRLRAERAALARHDSAERLRAAGVHLFFGEATFVGPDAVSVGELTLRFRRAVIATGSSPLRSPGLDALHTSDTIWGIEELPSRLLVVGGGPVGVEMAQAFARLGSAVTLLEAGPRLLPKDDPEAARRLTERLRREGVRVLTGARLGEVAAGLARIEGPEGPLELPMDAGLVAIGRRPSLDGLGLEQAGVALREGRLALDERLRTTNRRVYAVGDVSGLAPFTHGADAMARAMLRNAFFPGGAPFLASRIPWTTWTDPELAQLGPLSPAGARVITVELAEVDRPALDGDSEGFVRLHIDDRDRLISATILGPHAGDLISILSHQLSQNLPIRSLSEAVFPYPSYADALRRAADAANRQRLSPGVARLLRWFMRSWP